VSPLANYRFLPWTRQGLAAEIQAPDPLTAPLPAGRAAFRVALAFNGNPAVDGPDVAPYGPGDVIGIDPRVMVRTEPQPYSPDFEPNYLAAVDFDTPDFPWMLTPAAPNVTSGFHKLRPWLVLLVFDRSRVAPPQMQRGHPLPTIKVSAAVSAEELPDLEESWAWAHAQTSADAAATLPVAEHLAKHRDLNVSRLICPRRLAPLRRYFACLVPAFNQGVTRGLGGTPDTTQPLEPAWSIANPADIELPVYFHWEFSTGPAGDFEELARRLQPILPPATIGFQKTYLNPRELDLDGPTPDRADAYTWVEGALQAPPVEGRPPVGPGQPGAPLSSIPQRFRDRLRERLNEPATIAAGLPADAAQPIGPPIYGSWPANEHALGDTSDGWLRELNLDPRFRSAAGIGGEVVRKNQDDFMQACWEQVDQVLEANELLSRGRLAQEVGERLFARFFRGRPADHLIGIFGPLHERIPYRDATLAIAVAQSSVPNRAFDPALRRLVSPQRPVIKRALRRAGIARPAHSSLALTMNTRRSATDLATLSPDGLIGTRAVGRLNAAPGRRLDFAAAGLNVVLEADEAAALARSARGAAAFARQGFKAIDLDATIDRRGVVLDDHARHVADLVNVGIARGQTVLANSVLANLRAAGEETPAAAALLISIDDSQPAISAMFVEPDGDITIQPAAGERRVIGRLSPELRGLSPKEAAEAVASLAPASLGRQPRRGQIPIIRRKPDGGLTAAPDRPDGVPPLTKTTLPPTKDRDVLHRYKEAFHRYRNEHATVTAPPAPPFVALDFAAIRQVLLTKTNPRTTIPARIASMISIRGERFTAGLGSGIVVTPAEDRIMLAPKLDAPMYEHLAAYEPERFLPGLGLIPQNSIVLLATNPRFVEAYLVGLNHEMNRELLWRSYPTDQRGTIFQRFWAWADDGNDIPGIHTWPAARALGQTARQLAGGSQIVMLVRGELLRRYPSTVVLAWPGEQRQGRLQLKINVAPGEVLTPAFSGRFAPDFTFFGFSLTPADIANGNWFFVLQEQPTEPRFGFDTPDSDRSAGLASWMDATWNDVGTAEGAYMRVSGNPVAGRTLGGVTFGRDAAHLAAVWLQRPFRAALDAKTLLARMI
jgi:hypothetical protein